MMTSVSLMQHSIFNKNLFLMQSSVCLLLTVMCSCGTFCMTPSESISLSNRCAVSCKRVNTDIMPMNRMSNNTNCKHEQCCNKQLSNHLSHLIAYAVYCRSVGYGFGYLKVDGQTDVINKSKGRECGDAARWATGRYLSRIVYAFSPKKISSL